MQKNRMSLMKDLVKLNKMLIFAPLEPTKPLNDA